MNHHLALILALSAPIWGGIAGHYFYDNRNTLSNIFFGIAFLQVIICAFII